MKLESKRSSFLSGRIAKYNQLLRIEQELGADAVYGATIWPKKK